ncbi:hypothetical protein WT26_33495 [Burkholderia cepacia]|uniref:Transmembrane protein n=1 Tax=Burkholderia cepacia TaxID=292 RepID=A0A1B4Q391_BURCE|nr:hypothetical protein WT26_33495 [Burkholderia cepacia]
MRTTVWILLALAIASWGACVAHLTDTIHFGWIGTLFASAAGLVATLSSYLTEDEVCTRGGATIYKAESPIKFLSAYALVGGLLAVVALISIFGCLGRFGQ